MHKIYIIKFLIIASFTFSLIPLKNIEAKTNNPKAQNPTKAEKKKSESSNVVKNPETIANSNQVINPEPQNDLVRKFQKHSPQLSLPSLLAILSFRGS